MTDRGPAGRIVLATDLDGTFAHGSTTARDALVARLAVDPAATLVYVTGRTPEAARALAERTPLPPPAVLIADVGTSVLHGLGPARVAAIESELARAWPGEAAVRERLGPLHDLTLQGIAAPRRVSYWIEPARRLERGRREGDAFAARLPDDPALAADAERVAAAVAADAAARLEDLEVDVLVSANIFLDVLPRGVNKGSTLRRVLHWLRVAEGDCVVAGDSLNDMALFEAGMRGIAVGNCEPALRRRVERLPHIYQATAHGVEGVLEGLRHHGFWQDDTNRGHDHGG